MLPEQLKKHQFKAGQSGNPKGRPKGTSMKRKLMLALKRAKRRHNKDFIDLLVEVAYQQLEDPRIKNKEIASILTKKLFPDMIEDGTKKGTINIITGVPRPKAIEAEVTEDGHTA